MTIFTTKKTEMIYCIDIDGTLCTNTDGDYPAAEPFHEIITQINRLFSEGHHIVLNTARGGTTGIDWRKLTENQLKEWNVNYHSLHMGKPSADYYIDDKAINVSDWINDNYETRLPKHSLNRSEVNHD